MIHAASWDTGHLGSLCSLGVGVATLHDWKSMFVNLRGNSYAPQLELGSKQTPFWIVFFASRCIFSSSPIFSLSGCPLWLPLMFCRRDNLPPLHFMVRTPFPVPSCSFRPRASWRRLPAVLQGLRSHGFYIFFST